MAATQPETAFVTEPYSYGEARSLAVELDLSEPVAVTLVRRGYRSVDAARAFLAASEAHDPFEFDSMEEVCARLLAAASDGRRITVHGDYDVDGVCSTAILVAALRALGAECDWYIPDRGGDGYGLTDRGIAALAERGTELLLTVDCGIASAAEVAGAVEAGLEVIVTDHHAPSQRLPDCPILHPRVSGYPFGELCAAGVAHKLAEALRSAGRGSDDGGGDLDLVALATVADMVPLVGENRRLVREGLGRARRASRVGLRALMAVSRTDPATLDETDLGFRLAPRINAAGRLYRADAGVELMLSADPARAEQVAAELDRANADRRAVERRLLVAAEAARAALSDEQREAPALVLAGEGWHGGVIGIVASRLVERHWRPVVMIGTDGGRGRGSARSIPGFDITAALDSCAPHLVRYGGHSGAAGLEIEPGKLGAFRDAFCEVARQQLSPEALVRSEAVDAVVGVGGEGIGLDLAEELERLAPFGSGNPGPRLLMPSALVGEVRPMGDGSHARFQIRSGSGRALGVAFNVNGELAGSEGRAADLAVSLELDQYNGAVQPRVVLEGIHPLAPSENGSSGCPGCEEATDPAWWSRLEVERSLPGCEWSRALLEEADRARSGSPREVVDRRGGSAVAALAELASSGESVLALCADASRRSALVTTAADPRRFGAAPPGLACCRCSDEAIARALAGEGEPTLALLDWGALARAPAAARGFEHVVVVDPPPFEHLARLAGWSRSATADGAAPWSSGFLHLAWGPAEHELATRLLAREWELRPVIAEIYDAVRSAGGAAGEALRVILAGDSPHPRPPEVAGRCVRVLADLGLLSWEGGIAAPELRVLSSKRTELDASEAYRAYRARHEEGARYLRRARQQR